jgi:hypothetical protein
VEMLNKLKEMVAASNEVQQTLKFEVANLGTSVAELKQALKYPPVREIDVDVRKHLESLSKIEYFPFEKLY